MKKRIIVVLCMLGIVLFMIVWNSELAVPYRAFKEVEQERRSAHQEKRYKNEELLEIVDVGDVSYYIFSADEYNDDVFNAKIYAVVKVDEGFLGFKDFMKYAFIYDNQTGISWSIGLHGTTIIGLKQTNDFDHVIVNLDGGETIKAYVTDTLVIFYITEEILDIENIEILYE